MFSIPEGGGSWIEAPGWTPPPSLLKNGSSDGTKTNPRLSVVAMEVWVTGHQHPSAPDSHVPLVERAVPRHLSVPPTGHPSYCLLHKGTYRHWRALCVCHAMLHCVCLASGGGGEDVRDVHGV